MSSQLQCSTTLDLGLPNLFPLQPLSEACRFNGSGVRALTDRRYHVHLNTPPLSLGEVVDNKARRTTGLSAKSDFVYMGDNKILTFLHDAG